MTLMGFDFRELRSVADIASALRLRNLAVAHHPITLDQFRQRMSRDRSDRWILRVLASRDGIDRAYGFTHEPSNLDAGVYFSMVSTDEIDAFASLFEYLIAKAECRGAKGVRSWVPSHRTEEVGWLLAHGFKEVQRNPLSACDLTARDFDAKAARASLAGHGIEVIDLAELARRNSAEYLRIAWRLEMNIFADVPSPEPFVEVPFEEFEREFDDPHLRPEAILFALRDGELVGMTSLASNVVDSRLADTSLTGTIREARGLGVATALKTISLAWAKSAGIEKVYTDNEEANPMRRINDRLGFTHQFNWLILQRD